MSHLLRDAPVLFYLLHYVLAAVLVFQGVQQIEEQRAAMGFVPTEVVQKPAFHVFWGWTLLGLGGFAAVLGLGSHAAPAMGPVLIPVVWVELLAMAVFGFSLVFIGRKVQYVGKPSAPVEHSHH
jgi:Na+/proline symporter